MTEDGDVELTVVVLRFRAADPEALLGVLAKYVVVTRVTPAVATSTWWPR